MSFFVVSLCRFNQVNAISLACSTGLEDCKTLTTGWFRELMQNPTNNTWVQSATFSPSPLVFLAPPFTSTLFCPSWHFLHSEISNFPACSVCCVLLQYSFRTWITLSSYVLNCSRINPNLKSVVYCNAIKDGGEEEWDFAWALFQNATVATEAEKLMHALACTTEPWLLNR